MLKIRSDQLKSFEAVAQQHFEVEMARHLREFSPKHCDVIGEAGVENVIRLGLSQARNYGFTNQGSVRFYIELMFMFGGYFDTDLQLSWASECLTDPLLPDQTHRADQLHNRMIEYLEVVSGPENRFAHSALKKTRNLAQTTLTLSESDFTEQMSSYMRSIYPQKCDYLGDALLVELIKSGVETAHENSIKIMRGTALFVVLKFALGHGFANDPLFPWASKTLNDAKIKDPDQRAERLEQKALTYLNHVLSYLGE